MPSGQPRQVLRPSLLDRLLAGESPQRPLEDLHAGALELRREVLRDLQFLLSTRTTLLGAVAGFQEVGRSVLVYGAPDISSMSAASKDDEKRLTTILTDVIRRFEPRLDPKSIKVEPVPRAERQKPADAGNPETLLQFRISAVLHVEPIHEMVTFDTHIEVETGAIRIPEEKA